MLWDKYMFNNMTVVRLDDMSHCARSRGKKHCALQPLQDPVVLVSQAANLHLGGAGLTSFNVVFLLQICKT